MELIGFHSQIDTAIYKVLFSNVRVYTFTFALVMVRQEMKDPKDQEKKKKQPLISKQGPQLIPLCSLLEKVET